MSEVPGDGKLPSALTYHLHGWWMCVKYPVLLKYANIGGQRICDPFHAKPSDIKVSFLTVLLHILSNGILLNVNYVTLDVKNTNSVKAC